MKLWHSLLCLSILLSSPLALAGAGDEFGLSPFWKWKEIETTRFRITFPEELEEQAKRVAQLYEDAHETLKTELAWEPRHKVQVLLTDGTDAANGMTTPLSRFGMILYLTPPETWFSTNNYDDWLKLLVYHEYTHYLNMDATRGIYTGLRYVFGDILLPNALWPPWMLEGYAVYFETKYTKAGRGRSPYYSMVVRSLIQDQLLDDSRGVTLDRVAGRNPHAPDGETIYLFGYHLTHEAAKEGPNILTDITSHSSERIPYFINGNLQTVIEKDWYDLWDQYVAAAKTRAEKDLATIRSQPLSNVEFFEDTSDDALGVASSPDLAWIAYGMATEDRWNSLYLKNLESGKTRILEDRFLGVGMEFTPDSKRIVSSSLNRQNNYQFYSDLKVYDIDKNESYYLTQGARAKDPTLSPDRTRIAYIVSEGSSNDLYVADLEYVKDRLELKNPKKLVDAAMFDRISNPKSTPDGKSIVFTMKTNGELGENLMMIDWGGGGMKTLLADGTRNRFPAMDKKLNLYFVSDKTGVDNLYLFEGDGKTKQVTNVTSGLWLPVIRGDQAIASVYRGTGWALAKVSLNSQGYDSNTLKIAEFDAPAPAESKKGESVADFSVHDYSPWKSLVPRQWAPLIFGDSESWYFGGIVSGYDATFRHLYSLTLAVDSQARMPDYSLFYQNRSFGPTLDLSASSTTTDVFRETSTQPGLFTRKRDFGLGVSYPLIQTVGRFTPRLGFDWSRDDNYEFNDHQNRIKTKGRLIHSEDLTLQYGDSRSSKLAVWQERGSASLLGVRHYALSGAKDSYKLLASHREFFNLGSHWVLSPFVRAVRTTRTDRGFYDPNVNVIGKVDRILNPLPGDGFDEVYARGYPISRFTGKREAYTASADLRFPLWPIFRGWGTNPFYANQLFMQVFAEETYLPDVRSSIRNLTSAGAGLRLSSTFLQYVPLTFALDYHRGFNQAALGEGEVFFSIQVTSPLTF